MILDTLLSALSAFRRLFSVTPDDRVSDETLRYYQRQEMRQGWAENHVRWHSPKELRSMAAKQRRAMRRGEQKRTRRIA